MILKGPFDEERCRKSAFVTLLGQYPFTIPVRIMNSGATFMRMIDKISTGHEDLGFFIDDIGYEMTAGSIIQFI